MEIWLISAKFSFVRVKCYTMLRLRIFSTGLDWPNAPDDLR